MSDVKRYNWHTDVGCMIEETDGGYIEAADYDALRAELCAIKGGGEAVEIEYPEYHTQGMGCGLEDRGITDRYEAMAYGFQEALDQMAAIIENLGPLYTHPPVVAEAEPAYQTCNGKSCGWCKEGKWACLFTEAQRKARDQLLSDLRSRPPVVAVAEAEPVEVVAYLCNGGTRVLMAPDKKEAVWNAGHPLMEVAQHQRIVAAISAPPASGAVPVPRELLTVACSGGNEAWQALEEIRALLAKGVKS